MSKVELKSCPFCGSEKLFLNREWNFAPQRSAFIECEDCGAQGPMTEDADEGDAEEVVEAACKWNQRHDGNPAKRLGL